MLPRIASLMPLGKLLITRGGFCLKTRPIGSLEGLNRENARREHGALSRFLPDGMGKICRFARKVGHFCHRCAKLWRAWSSNSEPTANTYQRTFCATFLVRSSSRPSCDRYNHARSRHEDGTSRVSSLDCSAHRLTWTEHSRVCTTVPPPHRSVARSNNVRIRSGNQEAWHKSCVHLASANSSA